MKKIIITLVLVVCCDSLFGQNIFQKAYGDSALDNAVEFQVTNDGGFILTGTTWSYGTNGDIHLLKIDSSGNVQWMKNYGGIYTDWGNSVQQTDDGGYIFCGNKGAAFNQKLFLVKTDSNGDTLWTKHYGNPSGGGFLVRQTKDHGYLIMAGYWLLKTDSAGNFIWCNSYGASPARFYSLADSSIIILMQSYGLVKINLNGTLQWRKNIFVTGGVIPMNFCAFGLTNNNGFIFGGFFRDNTLYEDCLLIKTDSLGDTLWSKIYAFPSYQSRIISVQQTFDGGYIAGGHLTDTTQQYTGFLLKTDASGNVAWVKKYRHTNVYGLQQTPDGGFVFLSYTQATGGGDIYLIKTDSAGNSNCNDSIINPTVIVPVDSFYVYNSLLPDTLYTYNRPTNVSTCNPHQIDTCNFSLSAESASDNYIKTISIFPNPFASEITITLPKKNIHQANFAVKNCLGQVLFSDKKNTFCCNSRITIGLSFLSKGIYLLDIIVDGERTVKKIVKE